MSFNTENEAGSFIDLANKNVADVPDDDFLDVSVVGSEEAKGENRSKEMVLRYQSAYLKQLKEEHTLRKRFVPYVYWLVVGLIFATFALLAANGILTACGKRFLSDRILVALMCSTLADIIGILYIAVRWLFVSSTKH